MILKFGDFMKLTLAYVLTVKLVLLISLAPAYAQNGVVKGKVKEKAGKATNDPNLTAEGQDEKLAGKVQKKVPG